MGPHTQIEVKAGTLFKHATIDADMFEQLSRLRWTESWNADRTYSFVLSTNHKVDGVYKNMNMSHFVLGSPPLGFVVDHKDGDPFNNRKENLRVFTRRQNSQNIPKRQVSQHQYVGVKQKGDRWQARASGLHIGTYDDEVSAASAYNTHVLSVYGEDARLNNIPQDKVGVQPNNQGVLSSASGYRGIAFDRYGRYKVILWNPTIKKNMYLGSFVDLEDAKSKYEKTKLEMQPPPQEKSITRNVDNQAYITLQCGLTAIVDEDDWHDLQGNIWTLNNGYAICNKGNKFRKMHHVVTKRVGRYVEDGLVVDHINNDKLDNRRSNLRVVTTIVNAHNRKRVDSTKRFRGVYKSRSKWRASITCKGHAHDAGTYDTEEEAASAWNEKAKELYGEYACQHDVT